MYQKHPRVPIVSRRHRSPIRPRHHRSVRVFHVEPRAITEVTLPLPAELPWADAVTGLSLYNGRLLVEYGR